MFIFNFKKNIIFRLFVFLILIIVLYEGSIVIFKPHTPNPVSYDQYNISKAQQFIYDSTRSAIVLTGSSLSLCFDESSRPENISNLSFIGLSSLTGLELVKKSGVTPQFVIVEVNFIDRPVNKEFIDSLFKPAWTLRKYVHALRSEWQPISVLISYIEEYVKPKSTGLSAMDSQPVISKELLRVNLEAYRNGKLDITQTTNILRQYIRHFEEKGTTVVFLEMPVHSLIYNDDRAVEFRSALFKDFPASKYHWILFGAAADNETSDGLHLNAAGVNKYVPLFNGRVRAIAAKHASVRHSEHALK